MQDVVIHDSLDEIEQTPAEEERSDEYAARPADVSYGMRTPEERESDRCHDPGERVKNAVPEHVDFNIPDAVLR